MQKELQIFTSLQRQDKPIDSDTLEDLESQTLHLEALIRLCVKEVLFEKSVRQDK